MMIKHIKLVNLVMIYIFAKHIPNQHFILVPLCINRSGTYQTPAL